MLYNEHEYYFHVVAMLRLYFHFEMKIKENTNNHIFVLLPCFINEILICSTFNVPAMLKVIFKDFF